MAVPKIILKYGSWESTEEIADKLIQDLKRRKICKPDLLFRVMRRKYLKNINLYGIDNPKKDKFSFYNEQEIYNDSENLLSLKYLIEEAPSVICIYDGDEFIIDGPYEYKFRNSNKKKQALIAIYTFIPED